MTYTTPNDVTCPYQFTGNAHDEFDTFFQAAYKFAVWVTDTWPTEFSYQVKHNDNIADGITIKYSGHWDVDAYAEFIKVLQQLPTPYPDGYLNISLNNHILIDFWHD